MDEALTGLLVPTVLLENAAVRAALPEFQVIPAAHPDNRCRRVELGVGLGGGTGQLTDFAAFVIEPANPNGGFKSSDIGRFIKLVLI